MASDDYPDFDSYYGLPFMYVGPLGGYSNHLGDPTPTPESIVRPMIVGRNTRLPKNAQDQLDMLKRMMDSSLREIGVTPRPAPSEMHPASNPLRVSSSSNISMQGSFGRSRQINLGAARSYAMAPRYYAPPPVYTRPNPKCPASQGCYTTLWGHVCVCPPGKTTTSRR
jgi:hypothetical protein